MSDERMIRVDNLKLLKLRKGLTDKDIAVSIGLAETSDGRIGKIISGELPFTEKTARRIEVAYDLGHGWMDQVHLPSECTTSVVADKSKPRTNKFHLVKDEVGQPPEQAPVHLAEAQPLSQVKITDTGTTTLRAPFIAWGRLGVELFVLNELVQAERSLPVPGEASHKCKWTQVEQDHPRLRIMRGDIIALDPVKAGAQLVAGKVYLFQDAEGTLFLGEYRPLAGGNFEAIPDAGLPLDRDRHGIKVLARKRGTWE